MRQQFVLQATVLTHEDSMSRLEVIEQIIGLTWLQHRVDISMFPVHETSVELMRGTLISNLPSESSLLQLLTSLNVERDHNTAHYTPALYPKIP